MSAERKPQLLLVDDDLRLRALLETYLTREGFDVHCAGNGYTRSATHTGPNGNSVTSQGGATYNAATGQIDQSRTTTGPEGHSATETRTIDIGQNN